MATARKKKIDWTKVLGVTAAAITVIGSGIGLYRYSLEVKEKKKAKAALNGAEIYYSLPEYNQVPEISPSWEEVGPGNGLNMYDGIPVANIG